MNVLLKYSLPTEMLYLINKQSALKELNVKFLTYTPGQSLVRLEINMFNPNK